VLSVVEERHLNSVCWGVAREVIDRILGS
jgi:hypothetical protein